VFGNRPNSGAAGVHEASIHDAGQAFVLTHSTVGRPRDIYAEFLSMVGIRHFLLIPLALQGQIDYRILLRRIGKAGVHRAGTADAVPGLTADREDPRGPPAQASCH
jgi:hypothetical protein